MSLDLELNLDQINVSDGNSCDNSVYEFGDFRLDSEHLMLYRQDVEITLTPKQVETLLALVEQCGEIVSKEVLMAQLWGNAVVEESNLIQNIHFLRKVLGDSLSDKPLIETLRRRGYRFNAEVRRSRKNGHRNGRLNGDSHATATSRVSLGEPEIASESSSSTRERRFALGGILAFLSIALLSGILVISWKPSKAKEKIRVAVLPLTAIDPTTRDVLIEQGTADSLINRLSSVQGFTVRSLSSVRSYADAPIDPLSAGHELKVDYVVASNYQVADGRLKVTAQLYDVSSGTVEDAFSYQYVANIFDAQDAIAGEFGNRLIAHFGASFRGPAKERGTSNEEAYREYLLAMNFNEQRGAENGREALERIERAVSLDPRFGRAWAAKALIHRYVASQGGDRHEQYQKSMEAINNALAIDPNLSEAYSVLCFNKNRYEYDPVGAERECQEALKLDPESPLAHKLYSNLLYSHGRFDEAIVEIRRAMELQPVSYDNQQTYALALFYARRYDESEAEWKRLMPLNRDHGLIYDYLVECLKQQGKESEAFEYMIKRLSIDKADDETMERFKIAFTASGWRGVTMERIERAVSKPDSEPSRLARLYADLGDNDRAFEYLEKAYQQRSNMIAVLRVDPYLDPLRDDPRYHDLIRRIEGR
jgi:DNA-binding winged helix-turn-helix (wHTH) protein/TolB-like protein/Tfp pilus assembly protein PilF